MVRESVLDCNPHEPSDIYIVIFCFALKQRRTHSCAHPGSLDQLSLDASMDTPLHHGQLTERRCVHSGKLHSASSGNLKLKFLLQSRYGGTCSNSIKATWELQLPKIVVSCLLRCATSSRWRCRPQHDRGPAVHM